MKFLFLSLMLVFSGLIVYGMYTGFSSTTGFSKTAKITELTSELETTSSVSTTIKTTTSTVRHVSDESTITTTSSVSTDSTIQPGDPECEELGCPEGTNFVGSKNSDMFHYCSCSYAKSINPENLVCFFTKEEAEEQEYVQSSCQPSSTTSSSTSTTSLTSISSTTSSIGITTTLMTTTVTTTTSITSTVPSSDHVVFSEVFYDTPGIDSDEEWIEVYNPTSNSVDLSGLIIEDNNKNYQIPNGTTILPNNYLIIARNETGFLNLYGFLPDLSGLSLDLSNSGDYIKLKISTEEIDLVAWEGEISGWEDLKANTNKSIQRIPPTQDTDTPNDWISNAVPNPGI